MESSEDFSFPKINYPLPNFAISPSLWRVSSLVYPDYRDNGDVAAKEVDVSRRSFSFCSQNKEKIFKKECCEEQMDMLWVDFNFNEELEKVVLNSSTEEEKKKEVVKLSSRHGRRSSEKMVELCCAQALKMSNSRRPTGSTSIVVVMKVLKKLFLLKIFHRIKKSY